MSGTHEGWMRILGLVLLALTLLWLPLMALSTPNTSGGWGTEEYLRWVADPGPFFSLSYVNAALLTLVNVLFFASLHATLKKSGDDPALAGLLFIPIYGVMNLLAYGLQISIVPHIAGLELSSGTAGGIAYQLIQANPQTLIGFINGLAYAILGIPSILFGVLLAKQGKPWSGASLIASGALSLMGILGYALRDGRLSLGIMVSGVVFLFFLAAVQVEFRNQART